MANPTLRDHERRDSPALAGMDHGQEPIRAEALSLPQYPHRMPAYLAFIFPVTRGYAGVANATMPGQGKVVERAYTDEEVAALGEAAGLLGETTRDIYLNQDVFWRNVPERVWGYTLGGYPVIKKWLSYREQPLLGRALTPEEARYVMKMVRRIAAILLMGPRLDENYRAVKAAAVELSG